MKRCVRVWEWGGACVFMLLIRISDTKCSNLSKNWCQPAKISGLAGWLRMYRNTLTFESVLISSIHTRRFGVCALKQSANKFTSQKSETLQLHILWNLSTHSWNGEHIKSNRVCVQRLFHFNSFHCHIIIIKLKIWSAFTLYK